MCFNQMRVHAHEINTNSIANSYVLRMRNSSFLVFHNVEKASKNEYGSPNRSSNHSSCVMYIFPTHNTIHTSPLVHAFQFSAWWNNLLRVSRATNVQAFKKCITQTCLLEIAIVAWCVRRAPSLDICPWTLRVCVCVCGTRPYTGAWGSRVRV